MRLLINGWHMKRLKLLFNWFRTVIEGFKPYQVVLEYSYSIAIYLIDLLSIVLPNFELAKTL
jgi:hypothetical protein